MEQIDIQADVVRGLTVLAEGKPAKGTELLKAAAAREDATEKHAVVPGPLLPARELLADVLLEAKKGSEALREFEAVLAKEPNRYRAIVGAGKAARLAGDAKKVQAYNALLSQQVKDADTPRKLEPIRQSSNRGSRARRTCVVAAVAPSVFNTASFWRGQDTARF